ncbi:thioredoxin [Xanthomonas euvesicatoria pv. alfalfae]|nr:hypothetical protein [Xanthomonas euvesicatoria]QTK47780.1 thioredoxin [Xanthomonas euvesicatoria pv. alfalfae]
MWGLGIRRLAPTSAALQPGQLFPQRRRLCGSTPAVPTGGQVRHHGVEDGKGRPLGRSFRVKLWPTIILLRDGQELARAVRPQTREDLQDLLSLLDAA